MPDIPDWVVFPESEWQVLTPAAAGFLQPDFDNELNGFAPRPTTFWGEVHQASEFAAVITRGGYLVRSWGRPKDYLHQTASIGKAFTRAVLGLAVYKLGLNPDEPVYRTWSGAGALSHPHKYLDNGSHSSITWRHLVDHTAGFGIESAYDWRKNRPGEPWRSEKWTGNPTWDMYSFRTPGVQYYSSANYVRLGQALTALWGLDLKLVLDNELFSKMSIPAERWSWMSLREAYQSYNMYPAHPGYGHYADAPYEINGVVVRGGPGWVRMTAEDLARFGLLVATGGIWKGERLLSAEWLISKSGANGSSVFGDSTSYVSGGRVTTDGLPDYLFIGDFQVYRFPERLINPNVIPGRGVRTTAPARPHVFGIDQTTRGLYRAYFDAGTWQGAVLDGSANLSRLSAVFDSALGGPQVFGIRTDNQALYRAYRDGNVWKFQTVDSNARLASLSAIFDPVSSVPQVFGVRADNQSLYQAYQSATWSWIYRVIDGAANLSGIDAVFDTASGLPQIFGIRAGTGALYQAYWNGSAWTSRILDANANLSSLSSVFDAESNAPQVFGIRADNRALYQAYWGGGAWSFRVLDASANLTSLSAVFNGTHGVRQVFGIRADTRKLYQASRVGSTWEFRDLDDNANLASLSTVFDTGVNPNPQVFGIRADTRALYQAYWDGTAWRFRTLDGGANLGELDAAFGALVTYTLPG